MTDTARSSAHKMLRKHTARWHSTLDSLPALRILMRPELNLAYYIKALRGLAQAHAQAERRLQSLAAACPPGLPPYRARLPALQLDLQRLGATATEAPRRPTTNAGPIDQPRLSASATSYIGIRYVLEGATQGAAILSAAVAKRLPQLVANGAVNYWEVQQVAAADWDALSQYLARPPQDASELANMTAGAQYAYSCFIDSLSPSYSHRGHHRPRNPHRVCQ